MATIFGASARFNAPWKAAFLQWFVYHLPLRTGKLLDLGVGCEPILGRWLSIQIRIVAICIMSLVAMQSCIHMCFDECTLFWIGSKFCARQGQTMKPFKNMQPAGVQPRFPCEHVSLHSLSPFPNTCQRQTNWESRGCEKLSYPDLWDGNRKHIFWIWASFAARPCPCGQSARRNQTLKVLYQRTGVSVQFHLMVEAEAQPCHSLHFIFWSMDSHAVCTDSGFGVFIKANEKTILHLRVCIGIGNHVQKVQRPVPANRNRFQMSTQILSGPWLLGCTTSSLIYQEY